MHFRSALVLLFLATSPVAAQETFCEIAARNIPFTTSTSASVESVTRQVWDSSRERDFFSEEEFAKWSDSNDSGASYKLFSFSHGSSSSRQTGSFSERYSDYSRDYAETLGSFRANSAGERYPSRDFINRVLAACVPGEPIFVVVTPGNDLTSFAVRMRFNTPGISQQRITIINAECREGVGRFSSSYTTTADSATLECRRLNNALATVAFNSQSADAEAEMSTPDTVLERLEALIGRQAIRLADQQKNIAQLTELLNTAVAVNNAQNGRLDASENTLRLVGATCDMTSLGTNPAWKRDKSINGRTVHVRRMAQVKEGSLDDFAAGGSGDQLNFFCVSENENAKLGVVSVCPSKAACPWWP